MDSEYSLYFFIHRTSLIPEDWEKWCSLYNVYKLLLILLSIDFFFFFRKDNFLWKILLHLTKEKNDSCVCTLFLSEVKMMVGGLN